MYRVRNANGGDTLIAPDSLVHLRGPSPDGVNGYDIAASDVGPADPLYADVQRLQTSYPGFNALLAVDPTANNGASGLKATHACREKRRFVDSSI